LALRIAAKFGHLEVVKYLVGKGADIHALDGNNALKCGKKYKHYKIVRYL